MPTITEVAERLAVLYVQLLAREDTPEWALDRLFDAVADLDTLSGGITGTAVRAVLDE